MFRTLKFSFICCISPVTEGGNEGKADATPTGEGDTVETAGGLDGKVKRPLMDGLERRATISSRETMRPLASSKFWYLFIIPIRFLEWSG